MTTPIKWSELSARERDCLVAEKVMGWKRLKDPLECGVGFYLHSRRGVLRNTNDILMQEWSPTTDPRAAMEVVEKMRADKWDVDLQSSRAGGWRCVLMRPSYPQPNRASAKAATLPEAVCLAALRAVGMEVEG